MARIRVALRKATPVPLKNDVFSFRSLEMNVSSHQVTIEGKPVHLTPIEFRILKLLIENQGKVLTHHFIQDSIWGNGGEDNYQSLRVFMTNLRRKIEKDPTDPEYIITEIGMEYPVSETRDEDIEVLADSVNLQRLSNSPVAFDRDQLVEMYKNIVRDK